MISKSTQSPRYDFEPIIHREPVRFPKGERLAVLIYVNIEHVPFGSTALAHAIYPGTLQFSPDILNHAGVTTAIVSDFGGSWMPWTSTGFAVP